MLVPHVTTLLLPVPSVSPTAVFFGTASVTGGMFSGTKFSSMVAEQAKPKKKVKGQADPPHLLSAWFSVVTTLPCALYADS